ncbi:helix-turn-helix domain-containing protein [Magnetospirillum sulfuroxidans]|uniref:Helix-turn-helix transcriptional regulator n=1 Tax=Magnetospirillum sulfuroxidans TaxID=611300 RepID=A0ABS5IJ09_9PROT|nr:helix-turn-helix transcriptional regulator [Magnetospirillum sulfuroxidans]MBR9973778.1 helix-turn-helix transcriptional regulator [Magnetospirillum sulfuroxidans]
MSDDRLALGNRLKEAREYVGLSQEEVAEFLGISRSAVSLAEGGKRKVDAIELTKLAKICQTTIAELTGEASEPPPMVEHLAREAKGLTEKDQAELLQFAKFLKSRADGQRGK